MWITCGRDDPPYTQNTQAAGWTIPPPALKDDFILVMFFNLASGYENMNNYLL